MADRCALEVGRRAQPLPGVDADVEEPEKTRIGEVFQYVADLAPVHDIGAHCAAARHQQRITAKGLGKDLVDLVEKHEERGVGHVPPKLGEVDGVAVCHQHDMRVARKQRFPLRIGRERVGAARRRLLFQSLALERQGFVSAGYFC